MDMQSMAAKAKEVSVVCAQKSGEEKNLALSAVIKALEEQKENIFLANARDLEEAEKLGVAAPVLKRLRFDHEKLNSVIEGIYGLIQLPDPVGRLLDKTELNENLILHKVSCPIGVIGVVFESRPDALVQIGTLCLKSGNAVLLKGGTEAKHTNQALFECISSAAVAAGMPEGFMQLLHSREDVNAMLSMDQYIDLIIPRGSNAFVQYIMRNTNIPVLGHADGICHVYVDAEADPDMAESIVVDSKTQYVSVCNAMETLLVHQSIAQSFLPRIKNALEAKGVKLLGCEKTASILAIPVASEQDWKTEYLDYKLSIKIVASLQEAVAHINRFGSGHTDSIVTQNAKTAEYFMNMVDTANAYWNCSTRFSDGFRYGFGAEVGISTNKIHARGPVGLEGLMIYKYKLIGHGDVVADYASGKKHFTHKKLM